MRVERRKAREELDSVNAIEWRTADDRKRFFLLVRRPKGGQHPIPTRTHALKKHGLAKTDRHRSNPLGLLAGLHEFPTVPNISGASATAAKVAEIPNSLLKDLIVDPHLCLYSDSKRQNRFELESGDNNDNNYNKSATGAMRIVHVKPVGDVIHVFSHIRKTYRVQWVLLKGGGDEPPKLRHDSALSTDGKTRAVQKGKSRKRSDVSEDSEAVKATTTDVARWVPLDQVEHAKCVNTGSIL